MDRDRHRAIWKGRYHLFYIFQSPRKTIGHGIAHCWGHASSADLLHWDYHPTPTAFRPPETEPHQDHIFSGGAFLNKDGVPTIIYYGVARGICIAMPEDDDLIEWRNLPQNPVIPEPKKKGDPGWGVYNVFDPHAWVEGDEYRVILGGKVKPHELHDTAYLFRSSDLLNWEYLRPFYNPNPHWTDEEEDCACPDFFKLGDRWMLVSISHPRGARYYLGRYENGHFVPEEHHRMNWPGGSCMSPESLRDDKGRRILWAWVLAQRKDEGMAAEEFGIFTMPRVLSLDGQGRLQIEPPEEFKALRREARKCSAISLSEGQETTLDGIAGDVLDKSIMEVYANRRQCVTQRIYPTRPDSLGVAVFCQGGTAVVHSVQAWDLEGCARPYATQSTQAR